MSRILADQDELQRIAFNLNAAKLLLEADLLVNLITHPVRNALIELQLLDLINQVQQLHRDCLLVQENLFSTEASIAQNHNFLTADIAKVAAAIGATALGAVSQQARITTITPPVASYTANRISDLATKLKQTYLGGEPRVRIDLNNSNGYRQFTVFIPGVQNFGLPTRNPFDVASVAREFTGQPNSAARAVELAMQRSGIGNQPTDRVVLVGHSLGGLIASTIAKQGKYHVNAVVTFGSLNDQVDLPKHIPQLNVVHQGDPVAKLDGVSNEGPKLGSDHNQFDWVSQTPEVDVNGWLTSHDLDAYRETSEQIDRSQARDLDPVKNALHQALGDGKVEIRYYEVERTN